jgi:hypothetical protein
VEDLGDSAAVGRCVEVQDASAGERLGQLADLRDGLFAGVARVASDRLRAYVDCVKHPQAA